MSSNDLMTFAELFTDGRGHHLVAGILEHSHCSHRKEGRHATLDNRQDFVFLDFW